MSTAPQNVRVKMMPLVPENPAPVRPGAAADNIIESFCMYYPAYTYAMAKKMSGPRLMRMFRRAKRRESQHYINLVLIAANSQSKDGANELIARFQENMSAR